MPPKLPRPYGRYLLIEPIASGGMATLYRARVYGAEGFARTVAVKTIREDLVADLEFARMFIDEAQIAVRMNHPNIVQLYELGRNEDQLYIAMEYVPGIDLRRLWRDISKSGDRLPIAASCFIVAQLCEALDYAHSKTDDAGNSLNLVHRDVSPQNILISYEGAVKLTDFGIVKVPNRLAQSEKGVFKGKVGYVSPEQSRGKAIDSRSDLFALGIILYELLTGHRCFRGENDLDTIDRVRATRYDKISKHNPIVPPALERVVAEALQAKPGKRFQSGSLFLKALWPFLVDEQGPFNGKRLADYLASHYSAAIIKEREREQRDNSLPAPLEDDGYGKTQVIAVDELGLKQKRRDEPVPLVSPNKHAKTIFPMAAVRTVADGHRVRIKQQLRKKPWILPLIATLLIAPLVGKFVWPHLRTFAIRPFLSAGPLVITTKPDSELHISIDGGLVGTSTPLRKTDLWPGEHHLEISKPGFRTKQYTFRIAWGEPTRIHAVLEPD